MIEYAFPCEKDGYENVVTRGMKLRDWFAGQALQSIQLHNFSFDPDWEEPEARTAVADKFAKACYLYADAMMLARDK